jgi:hypothetical protein
MMVDPQLNLTADLERRSQQPVQGEVDSTLCRILNRDHTKVTMVGFDQAKYLFYA